MCKLEVRVFGVLTVALSSWRLVTGTKLEVRPAEQESWLAELACLLPEKGTLLLGGHLGARLERSLLR